ncbi:MAG: YceI family protein [Oligoflexia bacterium]|nr:YceI family protein [Oligoflexia bacterium]
MKIILIATISIFFQISAFANIPLDIASGELEFLATGKPSMLKIKGKSNDLNGNLEVKNKKLSGTIIVKIDSFDTGIDLRNKHMKEKYLETEKYPEATLSIQDLAVSDDFENKLDSKEAPFTGTLEFHGVKKAVEGTFQIQKGKLNANFKIQLKDFAIPVPSYLGITVADIVDVQTTALIQKKAL